MSKFYAPAILRSIICTSSYLKSEIPHYCRSRIAAIDFREGISTPIMRPDLDVDLLINKLNDENEKTEYSKTQEEMKGASW